MKEAMQPWAELSSDSLGRMKGPINEAVMDLVNCHFKASNAELVGIATCVSVPAEISRNAC